MYFFLTNLLFISTSKWSYLWIYLFMVSMSQMYVHSFVRDIYKLFKHIYEGWLLIYYLILICIFFLLGTGTVIKTHNCYSYFKWGTGMLTRFEKKSVIYRRIYSSNKIIGYSINHKLIWLSELEIQRTIPNPNYLLWTKLAVHWKW